MKFRKGSDGEALFVLLIFAACFPVVFSIALSVLVFTLMWRFAFAPLGRALYRRFDVSARGEHAAAKREKHERLMREDAGYRIGYSAVMAIQRRILRR